MKRQNYSQKQYLCGAEAPDAVRLSKPSHSCMFFLYLPRF
uniref:Uncharacterized protein n=1 Tax=Anguilla anguilla TaxID=7936 RepID=A0A0E9U3F1_ANGAN